MAGGKGGDVEDVVARVKGLVVAGDVEDVGALLLGSVAQGADGVVVKVERALAVGLGRAAVAAVVDEGVGIAGVGGEDIAVNVVIAIFRQTANEGVAILCLDEVDKTQTTLYPVIANDGAGGAVFEVAAEGSALDGTEVVVLENDVLGLGVYVVLGVAVE